MRIFKTRFFDKWAKNEMLSNQVLLEIIQEIELGFVGVSLGSNVYKKRASLPGRGKSGGARTLIAYKTSERAFFIFGFPKNEKGNLSPKEKMMTKKFATELLNYSNEQIVKLIKDGKLIEVKYET
jgi:hypothetical protein